MTMQSAIIAAYALKSTASSQVKNTVKTLHWLSVFVAGTTAGSAHLKLGLATECSPSHVAAPLSCAAAPLSCAAAPVACAGSVRLRHAEQQQEHPWFPVSLP